MQFRQRVLIASEISQILIFVPPAPHIGHFLLDFKGFLEIWQNICGLYSLKLLFFVFSL